VVSVVGAPKKYIAVTMRICIGRCRRIKTRFRENSGSVRALYRSAFISRKQKLYLKIVEWLVIETKFTRLVMRAPVMEKKKILEAMRQLEYNGGILDSSE